MGYITRRIDRLRKLDAYSRLLSVHDYEYCSAFPEKVDFISIQEWKPNIYNSMLDVKELYPTKPIFNIEYGGYERTIYYIFDGVYEDRIACLERNYLCVFAGTYSTYCWQNSSWYNVVCNISELDEEHRPSLPHYENMVALFEKYNFNSLHPRKYKFTTYCLTNGHNTYIFRVPEKLRSL